MLSCNEAQANSLKYLRCFLFLLLEHLNLRSIWQQNNLWASAPSPDGYEMHGAWPWIQAIGEAGTLWLLQCTVVSSWCLQARAPNLWPQGMLPDGRVGAGGSWVETPTGSRAFDFTPCLCPSSKLRQTSPNYAHSVNISLLRCIMH